MLAKTALVTGAASGIGKATAPRLADEGAKVALADVNEPELAKVADAICTVGVEALAIRLDVALEKDWQAAVTRILGVAFAKPITDLGLADWRRVMATSLDGVFLGAKHAMRAMKSTGGGCIIGPLCDRISGSRPTRRDRFRSPIR